MKLKFLAICLCCFTNIIQQLLGKWDYLAIFFVLIIYWFRSNLQSIILASPIIITATDDNYDQVEIEKPKEVFVDKWTYKNHEPNNTPLLSIIKRNHTLPETANDTVST